MGIYHVVKRRARTANNHQMDEIGWWNWYADRGRCSVPSTKKELRKLSNRRVF